MLSSIFSPLARGMIISWPATEACQAGMLAMQERTLTIPAEALPRHPGATR